jgi:hypothetical protein
MPVIPLIEVTETVVTEPVAGVPCVGAHEALIAHEDVPNNDAVICDALIIELVI